MRSASALNLLLDAVEEDDDGLPNQSASETSETSAVADGNGEDEDAGSCTDCRKWKQEPLRCRKAGPACSAPAAAHGPRSRERGRGGRGPGQRGFSRRDRQQPTITDLLREGQEILVQIAKEPIAKKGARITSHIALPGRFLVYMPTVEHVGVSRKIESDSERQRLRKLITSDPRQRRYSVRRLHRAHRRRGNQRSRLARRRALSGTNLARHSRRRRENKTGNHGPSRTSIWFSAFFAISCQTILPRFASTPKRNTRTSSSL